MKQSTLQIVKITLYRIGKSARTFTEGLVEDNGIRIKTLSELLDNEAEELSSLYRRNGLLNNELIYYVRKFSFYEDYISVLELRDKNQTLIGYYCDVTTPLVKNEHGYFLTDLFVDYWIVPKKKIIELDRDEYEEARRNGLISKENELIVQRTSERIMREWKQGVFPEKYTV